MLNLTEPRPKGGRINIVTMSPTPAQQFLASLPPPPAGKEWIKVRTGLNRSQADDTDRFFVWKLVQTTALNWKEKIDALSKSSTDAEGFPSSSAFAEHVVTSQDSLSGLSLRYNVPASTIKKANNMFSSNNVQAFKVLRVPLCETDLAKRTVNNAQCPRDIILQQFKGNKLSVSFSTFFKFFF